MKSSKEIKLRIIQAGHRAVEQLIKVAEEEIVGGDDELSADKLKSAAQAKKMAIFDAFEILSRIESEKEVLEQMERGSMKTDSKQGFAERRSK
jgi:hypothetical protein